MGSQPHGDCMEHLRHGVSGKSKRPGTIQDRTGYSVDTRASAACSLQSHERPRRGVRSLTSGRRTYSGHQILLFLICLLAAVPATSALSFNDPAIPAQLLCSTVTFSWSGGIPSFELQIIDINTNVVLEDFPRIMGSSLQWVADGKVAGRNVVAKVIDATGQSAITEQITVAAGSANACPQNIEPASPTPTTTAPIPPSAPTQTTIVPPAKQSTSSSRTVTTTSSSMSPPLSTTSKALPPPTNAPSAPGKPSSSPPSLPSSAPDRTSISSTSTASASASSTTTGPQQAPSSPISAPGPTQSPSVTSSPSIPVSLTSSLAPPSLSSPAPKKTASPSPSLSPGAKAAIATAVSALIAALCALAFWLHRRAANRRRVVRSSGERADLQETCPLLSELDAPGRAVIAQRAWADSSPAWSPGRLSVFVPDGENDVLVIQRRRTPRSMEARASGWLSDVAPATTTTITSAGRRSLLSTATTTALKADFPIDRFTDSPIDPLLFQGDSTLSSSECLPSARPPGDLTDLFALLEAEGASYTREGRLTGTEIDRAVDTASERLDGEWDEDEVSESRTTAMLPPPYHHYTM